MNCGDCILLRAALRNRRSRLLFANYIRAFRAFPRSKTSPPYMHTARRKKRSFTGNSARTSAHFSVMFFRKTRKMSADVQAYSERNLTPYSGNSARTSNHFSVMFFRKTRKMSDGVLSVLRAKFDAVFGKLSPKPQIIFRRCFFRKTRKISDGVLSVLRAKFDAVFGKLSPNLKSFFGDVFSQDKASKPPLYMHTARRKKRSFTGNSARTSAHFSVMFFRKTRKMSADVQAYFKRNLTPYCGKTARKIRSP